MKKLAILYTMLLGATIALQTSCGSNTQQQNAQTVPDNPLDTLKTYLETMKMEVEANSFTVSHSYDSALKQYDQCLAFLNKSMQQAKNRGLNFYANAMTGVYMSEQDIYDSLHQAEKSLNCTLQILKWDKVSQNHAQEVMSDINAAYKLKNMALLANDTAQEKALGRKALYYALAGAKVIDSLRTNDMDDLRYKDFQMTSQVYDLLGNKKQAEEYNSKYKNVYYNIYKKMPEDN